MTRAREEVEAVLELAKQGLNQCEIARRTGIPRGTVRGWVHGNVPQRANGGLAGEPCDGTCNSHERLQDLAAAAYAYLLGLYLGDGSISTHARGVFRLRITLDRAYPGIVDECAGAIRYVLPRNRVKVVGRKDEQADEVSAYSRHWPCLFPQHGPGRKHLRLISLERWQRAIVREWPRDFLRGLIHSDGCRSINTIHHPKKSYSYPRYQFSNRSGDIRAIFCDACDQLRIEWRVMNAYNISVARAASVAQMDAFVGPKT